MARKIINDQAELIQAIKDKNRYLAWSKVKHIGIKDIQDPDKRFLIFNKAFKSFDPYRNNNFILFFKNMINFERMSEEDRNVCKFTTNRTVINIIKSNSSAPRDNQPIIVEEISQFMG